jgi:ArsR family transcriptional regulator
MEDIITRISDLLKVLCDSTRLNIILLLKDEPKTPSKIEKKLGKSQSTISQHLKTLAEANIVQSRKDGKYIFYSLQNKEILRIIEIIKSYIIEQQKERLKDMHDFDRLDTLL